MKKYMILLAALFLLTGCTAPAKTPTEPAASPVATTLPAEPSSAPTEPAPAEISVMDLVGTWEQVWAEVEGDRNEVDPSRYLLQITGEKENELFASYVCVDYSENGYTDRPLIRDDREMYPGCGNDSWVMDVDYISPFEATQAITLLENGDLLMQNSFFYDGTIPVVSYACFTRSTRELSVARVRQQLMTTGEYFAVAYLGYLDAEPQGGLMDWIKAENPQLLEIYPFIADIPQERIIGTMGEVYCIIPRWDNTTVAVDQLTDSVPGKVLYRSEVGSPIVLMCNGGAFAPDTQVVITDEDATTLWYPGLDENGSVALPYEDDWFKARDISLCMKKLRDEHGGKVPDDFDALLDLPGVGRKSANLIMGDIWGEPAIVADTHCIRLSNRMGFIDSDDPVKVEFALKKVVAPEESNDFCHRLVLHGRAVCTARKAMCESCCLRQLRGGYHPRRS